MTPTRTLPVADRWFEAVPVAPGLTLYREPHVHRWFRANIWHVVGRDLDLVIDTGMGIASLRSAMGACLDRPILAVATHGHVDHMGGHHEFTDRAVHSGEAATLATAADAGTLVSGFVERADAVEALPHVGWDLRAFTVKAAPATRVLQDGDRIDLGDRALTVIHLPGHSPGSIALLDESDGRLFSGDVIYDGQLIDDLPHSDVAHYAASMMRLRDLPVATIHGGHGPSFDRPRLTTLIDEYLAGRRAQGCPTPQPSA